MFWSECTVPEFWAGVDWLSEKNLDAEDQMDEARSSSRGAKPPTITHKSGSAAAPATAGERVTIDPDMRVIPNPGFVAWREDMERRGVI